MGAYLYTVASRKTPEETEFFSEAHCCSTRRGDGLKKYISSVGEEGFARVYVLPNKMDLLQSPLVINSLDSLGHTTAFSKNGPYIVITVSGNKEKLKCYLFKITKILCPHNLALCSDCASTAEDPFCS